MTHHLTCDDNQNDLIVGIPVWSVGDLWDSSELKFDAEDLSASSESSNTSVTEFASSNGGSHEMFV